MVPKRRKKSLHIENETQLNVTVENNQRKQMPNTKPRAAMEELKLLRNPIQKAT